MRIILYYDEKIVFSMLAQLDIPDFDIDFFSVSIEERKDLNKRIGFDPAKDLAKCNMKCGAHFSTDIFEGKKVEYIYANIEDVKDIRRKKLIYNVLDKIEEKLKDNNNFLCFEGKIKDNMTLLCNSNGFQVGKEHFKRCNCEKMVTIAYKISDTCIKPICIYLKC